MNNVSNNSSNNNTKSTRGDKSARANVNSTNHTLERNANRNELVSQTTATATSTSISITNKNSKGKRTNETFSGMNEDNDKLFNEKNTNINLVDNVNDVDNGLGMR